MRSHILSGLFLTNHWVEFNNILHEASIPRGDVHIIKILQLHVTLQSYGPFVGQSEAQSYGPFTYQVFGHILSGLVGRKPYFVRPRWNSIKLYTKLLYQEEMCIS